MVHLETLPVFHNVLFQNGLVPKDFLNVWIQMYVHITAVLINLYLTLFQSNFTQKNLSLLGTKHQYHGHKYAKLTSLPGTFQVK